MYNFKCQVCHSQINTNTGPYAEAAHIQPLGTPHNGPDTLENILCLCPNHHVMFDFGGFSIANDLTLIGIDGVLYRNTKHFIESRYLQYHRDHFM